MSQTPSSHEAMFSIGQFDIGPGGVIIVDSPNNLEVLTLIEQTPALMPVELYTLAVSYQQVVSNSGLGNRLAFIGLSAIFQHPALQQYLTTQSQPIEVDTDSNCPLICTIIPNWPGCHCRHTISTTEVKRIFVSGLELLIEVTQVEENKTYVILGVGPTHLEER